MQILNAQQIRAWDAYTIQHEPVSSIDLMERAASKCLDWIEKKQWQKKSFKIFCGKGNNGGDGLAIARMLFQLGYNVSVYIPEFGRAGSEDFQINLQRLHELSFTEIHFLQSKEHFPLINSDNVVIDALFGSGLNKPLAGFTAELVDHINQSNALIVSIDLPSGLFIDRSSKGNKIVETDYTLTFQCYKLGLLVQENAPFIGIAILLDIGLHPDFVSDQSIEQVFVSYNLIRQIFKPRNAFAHKGSFGHALLIAGSYGKIGAAVLAAKACLYSGVGLLTCYLPKCGYQIMQTALPEAMVMTDENENIVAQLPNDIEKYSVIGIGPGIGTANETQNLISFISRRYKKPLVIDADGLNCLALQKQLLLQLPHYSTLTPHPKEFDRLFGDHQNDFDRIKSARKNAVEHNLIIVLKSHHTAVVTPSGKIFFNSTGNPGMAKGGSGDVLTGIITSLVAQNYAPQDAAILGVYLHGLAGDFAANALSQETMIATDIIDSLSQAFSSLK
ncbi:MAG TPA: NAD(P)H-hydrate dehydratase [Flavisolibacter sp.]|nr:NAD(P)H-hydrate dehydratase [Flavisolibacter sp.]